VSEREVVKRAPGCAATLVGQVPRLEKVAELIRLQARRFDGADAEEGPIGEAIPLGARILAAALAFDEQIRRGTDPTTALARLRERKGEFDPAVLDALAGIPALSSENRRLTLAARQLAVDMVLDQDVLNQSGAVVVPRGHRITAAILARLRGHIDLGMIQEPIRVVVRGSSHGRSTNPAAALVRQP
jgi:hypothetical protein